MFIFCHNSSNFFLHDFVIAMQFRKETIFYYHDYIEFFFRDENVDMMSLFHTIFSLLKVLENLLYPHSESHFMPTGDPTRVFQ